MNSMKTFRKSSTDSFQEACFHMLALCGNFLVDTILFRILQKSLRSVGNEHEKFAVEVYFRTSSLSFPSH